MMAMTDTSLIEPQKKTEDGNGNEKQQLQELMCRIVNRRDKTALAELFRLLGSRIVAFSMRQVGDEATAREVLQDTMLAVWQKGHSYDQDKAQVLTWIYTIARNRCFDIGRRRMSRPVLVSAEEAYADTLEPEPAEELDDSHWSAELLRGALDDLPLPQRQAIALVYLKECSHQEAAEVLGIPIGTVKSRVRLGVQRLKDILNMRYQDHD